MMCNLVKVNIEDSFTNESLFQSNLHMSNSKVK